MAQPAQPLPLPTEPLHPSEVTCRTEALKQIREWSSSLITVQTAAVGAIAFWLQRESGDKSFWIAMVALVAMVISLVIGGVFLGSTLPHCLCHLPYRTHGEQDVFHYKGGGRIPMHVGTMVRGQSLTFVVSLIAFSLAAAMSEKHSKPTTIDGEITVKTASQK